MSEASSTACPSASGEQGAGDTPLSELLDRAMGVLAEPEISQGIAQG
ncbi:hypothetical protein [Nocardia wallacei]|nr:hypothetical protein [Nocardia wallacei]